LTNTFSCLHTDSSERFTQTNCQIPGTGFSSNCFFPSGHVFFNLTYAGANSIGHHGLYKRVPIDIMTKKGYFPKIGFLELLFLLVLVIGLAVGITITLNPLDSQVSASRLK
jgi:hypothetical protein